MRRLLIKKLCATIVLEAYLEVQMRFSRDKNFYKTLLALALPIALQDLIKFGLNMADNLMVGRLGETALSAVSIANQPFFLFSLISFGLASGGSVLVAQYYGKQENRAISPIFSIALIIALCASVICGTIVLLFPESIMSIFVPGEPDVIALGAKYLRIVSITYFTYGLSNTIILLLRGVELVRPTLIINIISFFINVALNWVLIFGKLGAPALGVEGAAIATVAARLFDVIAIMIYILRIDKKLNFNLRDLFSPNRKLFPDFVKYSIPVTLNETMWGLGILMIGTGSCLCRKHSERNAADRFRNALWHIRRGGCTDRQRNRPREQRAGQDQCKYHAHSRTHNRRNNGRTALCSQACDTKYVHARGFHCPNRRPNAKRNLRIFASRFRMLCLDGRYFPRRRRHSICGTYRRTHTLVLLHSHRVDMRSCIAHAHRPDVHRAEAGHTRAPDSLRIQIQNGKMAARCNTRALAYFSCKLRIIAIL